MADVPGTATRPHLAWVPLGAARPGQGPAKARLECEATDTGTPCMACGLAPPPAPPPLPLPAPGRTPGCLSAWGPLLQQDGPGKALPNAGPRIPLTCRCPLWTHSQTCCMECTVPPLWLPLLITITYRLWPPVTDRPTPTVPLRAPVQVYSFLTTMIEGKLPA